MICYHHDDMDGKSAGWLVHVLHPSTIEDHPQNYISVDYNSSFNKHTEKDDVIIVDVSFTESTYEQFLEICRTARSVTWIDHHVSSLQMIEAHKDELQAIENLTYFVSEAACGSVLTYGFFNIPREDLLSCRKTEEDETYHISAKYFVDNTTTQKTQFICRILSITLIKENKKNPTDTQVLGPYNLTVPEWLFYVDDYDRWQKQDPDSECFALGFDAGNNSIAITDSNEMTIFNNNFWADENIRNIIPEGRVIYKYIMSRYDSELSSTFKWDYDNTKFICKNATGNSWNFRHFLDQYDAAILFNYDGKSGKWVYSVYSSDNSDFDCSEFCKKFGGGGHFHASGFSTDELIFTSPKYKQSKDK